MFETPKAGMSSQVVVNVAAQTVKSAALVFARMSEALGVMMRSCIVDPFSPVVGNVPIAGKISYGTNTVALLYFD
jgi:hypothetical protein